MTVHVCIKTQDQVGVVLKGTKLFFVLTFYNSQWRSSNTSFTGVLSCTLSFSCFMVIIMTIVIIVIANVIGVITQESRAATCSVWRLAVVASTTINCVSTGSRTR